MSPRARHTTLLPVSSPRRRRTTSPIQLKRDLPLLRPAIGWMRQRVSARRFPSRSRHSSCSRSPCAWRSAPDPTTTVHRPGAGPCHRPSLPSRIRGDGMVRVRARPPHPALAAVELLFAFDDAELRRWRSASVAVLGVLALWAYTALGEGRERGVTSPRSPRPCAARRVRVPARRATTPGARDRRLTRSVAHTAAPGFPAFPVVSTTSSSGRIPFPSPRTFTSRPSMPTPSWSIAPRLLLIDNHVFKNGSFGAATFAIGQWEQPRVPAPDPLL